MKVIFRNKKNEETILGHTEAGFEVPRIGEGVFIGYLPTPIVLDVLYQYGRKEVIICLDTDESLVVS